MTNVTTCPACAGPDNAECATCHGTSEVTQAVYDAFIAERSKQEAQAQLQRALQELPIENVPGVEQSATVTALADNSITATVGGSALIWDDTAQTWV